MKNIDLVFLLLQFRSFATVSGARYSMTNKLAISIYFVNHILV